MVSTLAQTQTQSQAQTQEQTKGQTQEARGEKRVRFHNLSWQQYQQILTALPQSRAARLTYSLGTLEISMPLEDHERAAVIIGLFIRIWVGGIKLKMKSMRSTTLNREEFDRGSEPDNAYYIQNYAKVADRKVDLRRDPPPDLVVEIDITHTDIDKNELYAKMGVPEFWRFNGHEWRVYQLQDNGYVEVQNSPTFPMVEKTDLYQFIDYAKRDEIAAEDSLRDEIKKKLEG